eukprot:746867-Hanusia_phi.AAC.2
MAFGMELNCTLPYAHNQGELELDLRRRTISLDAQVTNVRADSIREQGRAGQGRAGQQKKFTVRHTVQEQGLELAHLALGANDRLSVPEDLLLYPTMWTEEAVNQPVEPSEKVMAVQLL